MSDPDPRPSQQGELTPEQQFWKLWQLGRGPDLRGFLAAHPSLSPADTAAILAVEQYERWLLGERVGAEEYAALIPEGPDRDQAICDVIWGEYLLREQLGEHPDPDEYRTRFPDQADRIARQVAVHQALAEEAFDGPTPSVENTVLGRRPRLLAEMELPPVPGYEVVEMIGRGGMGVVYKARQKSLDRIVALKIVAVGPAVARDPAAIDRRRREAKVTARLSHPNIVTVYDAGSFGSSFYLAMEYVSGVDLHRVLEQRGPLPVPEACEYARQAALGLQHAFEQGLVHRDIKPSNLMISGATESSFGTLKILDLGLARVLPSHSPDQAPLTHDGAFMGTPDFIAPEQANDPRSADIRSDLYSLGCTLYCMLTGKPPFHAATPLAKLVQHHLKDPPSIESLRPEVPASVVAVVRKLLAKQPEDRYQTPAELTRALMEASGGREPPVVANSPTGVSRPPVAAIPTPRAGLVCRLTGHTERVTRIAFAPCGRWLASASLDGSVRLWDVSARAEAGVLESRAGASCVAFSPDGRTILSGQERSLGGWSFDSRRPLWQVERDSPTAVAYVPTGDRFVSAGQDGSLRVHDVATGQELRIWKAHDGVIWGLAVTPDGRAVLSGGQDYSLRMWDVTTGESLAVFPEQSSRVRCVAISREGGQALTGGNDGILRVWDLPGQRERRTLEGHEGYVNDVAFSPDGRCAVSGSRDGSVRVWEVASGTMLHLFSGHSRWVTSVAWSPSAPLLASGGLDKSIYLWQFTPRDGETPSFST